MPVLVCLALLAGAVACVPHRWIYLRVPVEGPPGDAVVDVPLAKLTSISDDFVAEHLAFYDRRRDARPHRLVDTDGDGAPDVARVLLEIADAERGEAPTQLTILGVSNRFEMEPRAPELAADREPSPDVALIFERARLRR
jgi:hypothetical protein